MKGVSLTGVERRLKDNELIVSNKDLKGHITYANRAFIDFAGYSKDDLMGAPHSIVRHPHMPRCVFKLLWDTLTEKKEIFAYVVNRSANGDHYWVLAHVTPSFDGNGNVVGYHSNRRAPKQSVLDGVITPLYQSLLEEENKSNNRKDGMIAGYNMLLDILKDKDMKYDEFIFGL